MSAAVRSSQAPPSASGGGKDTSDKGEVNPHIPQFIAAAPWYFGEQNKGLQHQKTHAQEKKDELQSWYQRGAVKGPAATKWRKGACSNCGAMTHDAKKCVDRPRKLGARWTNSNIRPDEVIQDIQLGFEAKRDRWNGYNPANHQTFLQQHEAIEMEKRKLKQQQLQEKFMTEPDETHNRFPSGKEGKKKVSKSLVEGEDLAGADSDKDEEYKETEGYNNAPVGTSDPKTRTTIRNLRIREDVAKYLHNLDPESEPYNPKSRSMKDNPTPLLDPEDQSFQGDEWVRGSGEEMKFQEMNKFAWEAYERGQDIHLQALPSQAELLHQQFKAKKEQLKKQQQEALLAKYGGQEHLNAPKEIIRGASETYLEYNRQGKILKGPHQNTKSKYELKNSYCTGQAGIVARHEPLADIPDQPQPQAAVEEKKDDHNKVEKTVASPEKKIFGGGDERKRGYNSFSSDHQVTPEELEAYKKKKLLAEDPMRKFLDGNSAT